MKKKWSIGLSILAGIIALWWIFTKFSIKDVIRAFAGAQWWMICLYLFAIVGMMASLVWRWDLVIFSQEKRRLPFWHLFWYKVIGYAVSYVTPTAKIGGEPVRAGLLKRHNLSFHKGLSNVVIDKTLELSTCGLFFVIGALIILFGHAVGGETRRLLTIVILLFVGVIGYFYYQMFTGKEFFGKIFRLTHLHKTKRGKKWMKQLTDFEHMVIKFYHQDTRYFWYAIGITGLSWFFTYLEYQSILLILGYPLVNPLYIFLIFSFVGAAYLIPIPMAVGSLEASQIAVFSIINLPPAAGIALALVTRIKDVLWTAIGFLALSVYGLNLSKTVSEAQGSVSKEINRLNIGNTNNNSPTQKKRVQKKKAVVQAKQKEEIKKAEEEAIAEVEAVMRKEKHK